MTFENFGLLPELLRAICEMGYATPTPIQEQAIPLILQGKDLLAGAQTGTGKTAGFALALLQNLILKKRSHTPAHMRPARALILTPTRELASQVEENIQAFAKHLPLRSLVLFGGVNINPQIERLKKGVDIIVATPGRLLDLINQGALTLAQLEILVLDEADRMLDMGFIHDIRKILKLLPKGRQSLLFSATFSNEIKQLALDLLNQPALIQATPPNSTVDIIKQVIHPVDNKRKRDLLAHLISSKGWEQVLVFSRTKHGANRLSQHLDSKGIASAAIHGNKSQNARTKALDDFKSGKIRVLVATDIAARGLDIEQLGYVVNCDLPHVPEDYVHRIGRTGRAGCVGEAISLVCIDEHSLLRDIERLLKRKLPQEVIAGYEPDPSIKAEPIPCGGRPARPRDGTKRAPLPSQSILVPTSQSQSRSQPRSRS
jgi:ATP-dependent RNA helicase RhlE